MLSSSAGYVRWLFNAKPIVEHSTLRNSQGLCAHFSSRAKVSRKILMAARRSYANLSFDLAGRSVEWSLRTYMSSSQYRFFVTLVGPYSYF